MHFILGARHGRGRARGRHLCVDRTTLSLIQSTIKVLFAARNRFCHFQSKTFARKTKCGKCAANERNDFRRKLEHNSKFMLVVVDRREKETHKTNVAIIHHISCSCIPELCSKHVFWCDGNAQHPRQWQSWQPNNQIDRFSFSYLIYIRIDSAVYLLFVRVRVSILEQWYGQRRTCVSGFLITYAARLTASHKNE